MDEAGRARGWNATYKMFHIAIQVLKRTIAYRDLGIAASYKGYETLLTHLRMFIYMGSRE